VVGKDGQELAELRNKVADLTRQLGALTTNRPNDEIVQNRPEIVTAPIVERERSLSPVLNRERKRKLSPMSRNFKKTLHVNYIFIKIYLFIYYFN
jgi:hypothetical protein